MAVRTQTAAEIRSGRVGPRGRQLRDNAATDPDAAEHRVLPSVFPCPSTSRVQSRSRITVGRGTIIAVARVTATTSFQAV